MVPAALTCPCRRIVAAWSDWYAGSGFKERESKFKYILIWIDVLEVMLSDVINSADKQSTVGSLCSTTLPFRLFLMMYALTDVSGGKVRSDMTLRSTLVFFGRDISGAT